MTKYNKFSIVDFSNRGAQNDSITDNHSTTMQIPKKRGRPAKNKRVGAQMVVKSTELLTVYSFSPASKLQPYENEYRQFFSQSPHRMNNSSIKKQNKMMQRKETHESSLSSETLSNTSSVVDSITPLITFQSTNPIIQTEQLPTSKSITNNHEVPKRKIIRASILSIKELLN